MLSTPCESVQICTDPDRYSRIVRKMNSHKFSFRKRNYLVKKCSTKKTRLSFKVLKKFLCESVQICTNPCRYSSFQQLLKLLQQTTFPKYYNHSTLPTPLPTQKLSHVKFHPSKRSQYGKRASQS